ncbi:MAG TPA: hypothetical protein VGP68_22955, partial [Gemmataceae bacterium]|nr:hypothetical protein [Gemmataceae bacterium]
LPGIYELEGDLLKVCLDPNGKTRPAKFQSIADSGYVLEILQREREAGIDPKDASIVYDRTHLMNGGFKAYDGNAYDGAALRVDPKLKLVLPDRATVIERHDDAGLVLIYMEKHSHFGAHVRHPVSIANFRKEMGCAAKLDKGALLIGTFGELGFMEGSRNMKLFVVVPRGMEVAQRAGLSGGYGGRGGATRPPGAINPARDEPKPALTKPANGSPPAWLPPTAEDGWHEIPALPDVQRRAGGVAEKLQKAR